MRSSKQVWKLLESVMAVSSALLRVLYLNYVGLQVIRILNMQRALITDFFLSYGKVYVLIDNRFITLKFHVCGIIMLFSVIH